MDQIKKMREVSDIIGKEYLTQLVGVQDKLVNELNIPAELAMAAIRIAATGVIASLLAGTIVVEKGITDQEERQKIVNMVHDRFDELARQVILESGAKVVSIEIDADEEPS
jgi:hypothetical protein